MRTTSLPQWRSSARWRSSAKRNAASCPRSGTPGWVNATPPVVAARPSGRRCPGSFRVEADRNTIEYTTGVVGFEWDEANEEHIAQHGVTREEAEETFYDPARLRVDVYSTAIERRRDLLGRTEQGRLLFVVYTRRAGAIRVVTALDATQSQGRRYRRATRQARRRR